MCKEIAEQDEMWKANLKALARREQPRQMVNGLFETFKAVASCTNLFYMCVDATDLVKPNVRFVEHPGWRENEARKLNQIILRGARGGLACDKIFRLACTVQRVTGGDTVESGETLFAHPFASSLNIGTLRDARRDSCKRGTGDFGQFIGWLLPHDALGVYTAGLVRFDDEQLKPAAVDAFRCWAAGWRLIYDLKLWGPYVEHKTRLSNRMADILTLWLYGLTHEAIADLMDISPLTVRDDIDRVRRSVGSKNLQEFLKRFIACDKEKVAELTAKWTGKRGLRTGSEDERAKAINRVSAIPATEFQAKGQH